LVGARKVAAIDLNRHAESSALVSSVAAVYDRRTNEPSSARSLLCTPVSVIPSPSPVAAAVSAAFPYFSFQFSVFSFSLNARNPMRALTAIGYRPLVPVDASEFANPEIQKSGNDGKPKGT
jgi:hypothetical protein